MERTGKAGIPVLGILERGRTGPLRSQETPCTGNGVGALYAEAGQVYISGWPGNERGIPMQTC